MTLEQQVCNLEQAKKLKELGVNKDSQFYFHALPKDESCYELCHHLSCSFENESISAYTVAELGEMLPSLTYTQYLADEKVWIALDCGSFNKYPEGDFTSNTEAEARAAMLIFLLENKLISL